MHGTGAQQGLFGNSGTGQSIANTGINNANSLYGTLNPTLSTMATNPQGINPADMAKIQTSNMQTAGAPCLRLAQRTRGRQTLLLPSPENRQRRIYPRRISLPRMRISRLKLSSKAKG